MDGSDQADSQLLLAAKSGQLDVVIDASTIWHDKSGFGDLTTRSSGKEEILGYYYGTFVYADLGSQQGTHQVYGRR